MSKTEIKLFQPLKEF